MGLNLHPACCWPTPNSLAMACLSCPKRKRSSDTAPEPLTFRLLKASDKPSDNGARQRRNSTTYPDTAIRPTCGNQTQCDAFRPRPACMVRRRSTVRFRPGPPGGLHVSVGPIFTFGSDIPLARPRLPSRCVRFVVPRWLAALCRSFRACCRCLWWSCVAVGAVFAGCCRVRAAAAARHGEGLAAAAAGFRGQARRRRGAAFSCCRAFQAARMRWLRTISRVVVNSIRGPGPSGGTSRG